jgi:DNA-binding transcriptional ArsR family regulator
MLNTTKNVQHTDADVFTAIAHPVRRQLLDMLTQKEQSVTELAEPFAKHMSRPAISQHLRILLYTGLLSESRQGRERRYRLHAERLYEVQRWLVAYQRFWQNRLDALGQYLEGQEE